MPDSERRVLSESARPEPKIYHALLLGFFVGAVPTVLLVVLTGSSPLNVHWESPAFQTFLLSCSALLSGLIGYWLHGETRLNPHPAILTLAIGFACQALLLLGGAWLRDPSHLAWFIIFSTTWTILFSLASVLFIFWRAARHAGRELLPRRLLVCWGSGLVIFLLYVAAGLFYARAWPADQSALPIIRPWFGIPCVIAIGITLLFTFRLYLKRRTSVVLSFALALYLFGLAMMSRMLGSTWHLLWWYSHTLNFGSLFLVGYGILEGNRVREREMLIAELAALNKKLEEQSVRDPLTGCYNRRYVEDVLEGEFRKAYRAKMPLTLLVADVDDFKSVNDAYGHPFGDFVLSELAGRLREGMRTSDVLARCGGEEFYIVLPLTHRTGGQELASKLLYAVRSRSFERGGISVRTTVSIGIADNRTPGVTDVASLTEAADRALYSAKHAGKDRAMMVDPLGFPAPQPS